MIPYDFIHFRRGRLPVPQTLAVNGGDQTEDARLSKMDGHDGGGWAGRKDGSAALVHAVCRKRNCRGGTAEARLDAARVVGVMRDVTVQRFLDAAEAAIRASVVAESAADMAAARVFGRCRDRVGAPGVAAPMTLPVCGWLEPALNAAEGGPRAAVADAFGALVDRLEWKRRVSADPADRAFWDGHANAMILGPGGLEVRDDLWIGVTVMAPGVTYVDHDHPPEEVYLSLAPGEWWNAEMDWTDPGMTGVIYNPPGIRHAMRSGPGPFLALWFLPA